MGNNISYFLHILVIPRNLINPLFPQKTDIFSKAAFATSGVCIALGSVSLLKQLAPHINRQYFPIPHEKNSIHITRESAVSWSLFTFCAFFVFIFSSVECKAGLSLTFLHFKICFNTDEKKVVNINIMDIMHHQLYLLWTHRLWQTVQCSRVGI